MKKYKIGYIVPTLAIMLGSGIFVPASSFADDEIKVLDSCEGIESCAIVTSTAELSDAFTSQKSTVLMGGSFDLTADLRTSADMDFYLNNYTLTSDGWSIINVDGDLTIYAGENGKIVETGGTYAPLYVYNNTTMKSGTIEAAGQAVYAHYDTGLFTLDGGTISGGSDTAVAVVVSNGAKLVMNGGAITGDTWGVSVFKDAEFEMNGGTVSATADGSIGVSGNGSTSGNNEGTNAKITLNAGTINSGDLGVYAPQANGLTTLGEGITINAAKCGVEVRAGTLNVDGATISVPADAEYVFNPNGNGSTASGVAIAVAQHTTKQAISATVNSGNFTAPVAFGESNPQHNSEEDVAKVELSITGGTFNATNGDPIVSSEDVTGFVTGGAYNKDLDEKYVADGYKAYAVGEGSHMVLPEIKTEGVDDTEGEEAEANAEELDNVVDDAVDTLLRNLSDLSEDESERMTFTTGAGAKFWVWSDDAREALMNGHTIIAAMSSEEIDMDEIDDENKEYIQSFLEDGMVPFGIIEYWIDLYGIDDDNAEWIGEISEIPYPLTLTYDVSGAPAVAEGKTRTWRVVRLHWDIESDDEEPVASVINAEYDEETKTIAWENDKFSAFIVTYEDEDKDEAATPDTGVMTAQGSSAVSAAIIAAIAVGVIVSVASFAYLIRKK